MKSTVDELLERINIVDEISQYVKLKRSGKNFIGLCPFHKEKTPSFSVSTEKQIYYCFGCHEGGNIFNFLMKYENASFPEVVESLAKQYGVEIKKKSGGKKATLFDALEMLTVYYQNNLKSFAPALKYLESRGIDRKTIEEFRIGYSSKDNRNLNSFLRKSGIPTDILVDGGILRIRDGNIYDIFRGRIIIPIRDVNRKITGYGARGLEKDSMPKYINSPESAVFTKRTSIFGIDMAKKHIIEKNEVYIVEGYFDLISLYIKGMKNVVSTLGTAVTQEQLSRLRNYTDNITLMLDGDEAGVKSALRLTDLFSELEINGNVVALPEQYDPDSLVREKGIEGLKSVVSQKKPLLDYCFDYYKKTCGVGTLEKKMVFLRNVMPFMEGIRNPVTRRLYVKRLSELTGVEEDHFPRIKVGKNGDGPMPEREKVNIIERKVVGVLLNNPDLLGYYKNKEVIRYIREPKTREILSKMFSYFNEKRTLELQSFINVLEEGGAREFVLKSVFDVASSNQEELERAVGDYFQYMEKKFFKEEAKRITEKLSEAEQRGNEQEVMELLQQKRQVLTHLKPN